MEIFLKLMFNIQKKSMNSIVIQHFYLKERNLKKSKNEKVVHIRNLKQALNHGLILEKVYRVIRFNQDEWLKPYIEMNTKLTQTAKNEFEKYFFMLMNNAAFGKTMENVKNHRDIKLVTTERRGNY